MVQLVYEQYHVSTNEFWCEYNIVYAPILGECNYMKTEIDDADGPIQLAWFFLSGFVALMISLVNCFGGWRKLCSC